MKVFWTERIVKVRANTVVKPMGDGGLTFLAEAAEIKSEVEESYQAWLAKFGHTE